MTNRLKLIVLIIFLPVMQATTATQITSADGKPYSHFGSALAVTAEELFAGETSVCIDEENHGSVKRYVFDNDSSAWIFAESITPVQDGSIDMFGRSLAVSDNFAMIGARGNCALAENSGVVFIMQKTEKGWALQQTLTSSNPYAADDYGRSVAINEHYAAVGASTGAIGLSGVVYLYKKETDGWTLDQQVVADTPQMFDYFGYSVAIHDSTLIVGAPTMDSDIFARQGHVYVFEKVDSTWVQKVMLTPSDPTANHKYGFSVDFDGNHIVVGAPKDDVLDFDTGSAYLYAQNESGDWFLETKLSPLDVSSGDHFGAALALSDKSLVIGAPGADGLAENTGAVYAYRRRDAGWVQTAKATPGNGGQDDSFGYAVAVSNAMTAVGAPGKTIHDNVEQGAVYIYDNIQDLALPVQLCLFNATIEQSNVLLHWQTQSELDNLGFLVQRRQADHSWQTIASFEFLQQLEGRGSATNPADYFYRDADVKAGQYFYRLVDVSINGEMHYHQSISVTVNKNSSTGVANTPATFKLFPAFPNPFNPQTTISFEIFRTLAVDLSVFDINGHKVATLMNKMTPAGRYRQVWNGEDDAGVQLGSGLYLIILRSGAEQQTRKVMLIR